MIISEYLNSINIFILNMLSILYSIVYNTLQRNKMNTKKDLQINICSIPIINIENYLHNIHKSLTEFIL